MSLYLDKFQAEATKAMEHFKKELAGIRAGRANPAMIENVPVDAYGVKTPLLQMASIHVPEPRVMTVEPWDKNLIKDIEKALTYANLGLSVMAEKTLVRVKVPTMTEENRKDMVRQMNDKLEAAKQAVRACREKIREEIVKAEKDKELTEDDKFDFLEELDKKAGEWNVKLKEVAEAKEKDIRAV